MLEQRGAQAGVQNVTPHRFRHTFADKWLELGGNVDDLLKPFFTQAGITALVRACIGQDFESRGVAAIIRILANTGVRGVRPGLAAVQRRL